MSERYSNINAEIQGPQRPPSPLDVALACARRGIHVFPVHSCVDGACSCSEGKDCIVKGLHPRNHGGWREATVDEGQIREWFSMYPDANIGMWTGKTAGIVALEIPRGEEHYLRRVESNFGRIQSEFSFPNGTGGRYLLFEYPEREIGHYEDGVPQLGLCSDGDYIVVNASDAALLVSQTPFPKFPEAALKLVDYCLYMLQQPVVEFIPKELWAEYFLEYARALFLRGFSWREIEEALLAENRFKCAWPASEERVKEVVQAFALSTPDVRA